MPDTLVLESEQASPVSERIEKLPAMTFGLTIFLGAFLLFQVQLIIGKYILPLFGGAPAVWTTSMLCFQLLLLLGYAYAHLLASRCRPRTQSKLHMGLLLGSLVVLLVLWMKWGTPLTPGSAWKPQPGENPVWKILELLGITVGLPFFLLSTTGPLLQRWFHHWRPGSSVYRLYGLSNAGSLLGLLAYPFFFEWVLTIKQQARVWSLGYVAFVLLCAGIAFRHAGLTVEDQDSPAGAEELAQPGQQPVRRWLWVALSCLSSIMLLATTNRLCQDLAVIPFLWVLPLSIYLFSFILTFENTRWYSRRIFWPLYFLSAILVLEANIPGAHVRMPLQIGIYSLALFVFCMVCHGELARSKPVAQHLTRFYFMVALGGAAGGVFVVLIAPHLFRDFWEFQFALLGCGLLLFAVSFREDPSGTTESKSWEYTLAVLVAFFVPNLSGILPALRKIPLLTNERFTLAAAGVFLIVREILHARRRYRTQEPSSSRTPWKPAAALALFGFFVIVGHTYVTMGSESTLLKVRNFFGVKRVINAESDGMIELQSGSTVHGGELKDIAKRGIPTWYYQRSSGAGLFLSNLPRGSSGQEKLRVGLLGLGVGTLAAYAQPGDYFRFYEIDPTVVRLTVGPQAFFHFIADSQATVEVQEGDARLSLEREAEQGATQNFDVFVVDAFSGDSIPVHLLTREATKIYLHHLRAPDGVLAFHISNRYLDLAPVVQGLADSYHLSSAQVRDKMSLWILLSRNPAMLQLPNLRDHAVPVVLRQQPVLWTDDYSNLLQILKRPGK